MNKLLSAAVALMAAPAVAADLPSRTSPPVAPSQVQSWEGFYAGGHVGIQRDRHEWSMQGYGDSSMSAYQLLLQKSGLIVGVHSGYNFQSGNFVYGFEADANWRRAGKFGDVSLKSSEAELGPSGSLRIRSGFAMQQALIYLTGGLAIADIEHKTGCVPNYGWCTPAVNTGDLGNTRVGWTVGGGVDWFLRKDWSIRAEYRYSNFGSLRNDTSAFWTNVEDNPRNYKDTLSTTSQALRIGLTHHFNK